MKLYTIGFTKKDAKTFFGLLIKNNVKTVIDIRLNNHSQLAGFTKQEDLPYFLNELAAGSQYVYRPELAPTLEIMNEYRKSGNWQRYERRFLQLMDERQIPSTLDRSEFEIPSCLLCSESTPEHCHRRLVAERMAEYWQDVEIVHL